MASRPEDEPAVDDEETPSTGYFVLILCVVLVVAGLWVMGVIPGLF
jgi:hypothetical protein